MSAPRIAVLGSMCLDLIYDRPPTKTTPPIHRSHGGVGRNVAANLGWLGAGVRLVALSSPTRLGDEFAAALRRTGVDLSAKLSPGGIGRWIGVQSADGEVTEHGFQAPKVEDLDWRFVRRSLGGGRRYLVYESAANPELVGELHSCARRHGISTYCIPTRLNDLGVRLADLRHADCLLMNRQEAQLILDEPLTNRRQAMRALAKMPDLGLPEVLVTLGAEGVAAVCRGEPPRFFHQIPVARVVNTLGCGDAFTAGFVFARASGAGFADAVERGLRRARATTATIEAVCLEADGSLRGDSANLRSPSPIRGRATA